MRHAHVQTRGSLIDVRTLYINITFCTASAYLLWMYLEAYTAGMNLLFTLDQLHPEEGHEHPQLGVALPVERVLRKVPLP